MKKTKSCRDQETSPFRYMTTARPDNGVHNSWATGLSSEMHKDNSYQHLKLACHASLLF